MSKQKGFSVGELMVTIGLAIVVAGIALPSTTALLKSYRLSSSANQLGLELMRARTMAVSRNTDSQVIVRATKYKTQLRDPITRAWVDTSGFINFPSMITVGSATRRRIAFDRTGMTARATLILTDGNVNKILELNSLGKVTVL